MGRGSSVEGARGSWDEKKKGEVVDGRRESAWAKGGFAVWVNMMMGDVTPSLDKSSFGKD